MQNLTLLTDFYQLTMMNGYFRHGMHRNIAVFDLFFRNNESIEYAVAAGLEQVTEYIRTLCFTDDDIAYLRAQKVFDEDFLQYLSTIRFTGDLYAMPEGTLVFPTEPLIRVKAPIIEAQLVETTLLNLVNHQTLIATKASRVVYAAEGDSVLEFGLRRAQGPDAGLFGARAALIGGCNATSNVLAGKLFNVPVRGTHSHSWVMSFPDELTAFRAYAQTFPDSCLLLVDTYDTLQSGVPNAITVFRELVAAGHKPIGIRLDSGDLAYLSKQARKMLDEAGFNDVSITASSDLDEWLIRDLKAQGARISVWGVGTKLITSYDNPALGGVYKMSGEQIDGTFYPKIKLSDNPEKMTNPGIKKVFRLYERKTEKAIADLIALDHETVDDTKPLRIFSPTETWKHMTVRDFTVRELLVPVFIDGKQVYDCPDMKTIQTYARQEMESFWEEYKRLRNPHVYKVDLSDELFALKQTILKELEK